MPEAIEIRHCLTRNGRDVFEEWLSTLSDVRTQAKIAVRIDRLALGNFGDCKSLGSSLHELRIDWGPGYRVYFAMSGPSRVLLERIPQRLQNQDGKEMKRNASISHDEAIIRRIRQNPQFAAEYPSSGLGRNR